MTTIDPIVTDSDIPPTDPVKPAKRTKAVNNPAKRGEIIAADSLLPSAADEAPRYLFSCGLLPTAPKCIASVDVAGWHFCRGVEAGREVIRTPFVGSTASMSADDVRRLAAALPGRVFRALAPTKNLDRNVAVVRIPSPAERQARLANGFGTVADHVRHDDIPVAAHIWVKLIPAPASFRQLRSDDPLPAPVSETGLEIPGDDAVPYFA